MNRNDLNHLIARTLRAIQTTSNPFARTALRNVARELNAARRNLHNGNPFSARRNADNALRQMQNARRLARAA